MKFLGFLKRSKEPRPDPVFDAKRRQLEALISVAASIQNYSFNGRARHFLTARHGRRVRIPARTLYYEADTMWLNALKLARDLGDRKSELRILFLWGRLQHVPPSKSILFPGPVSSAELVDIIRAESVRGEDKEADNDPPPQGPIPELALRFYREAMPLAVELGDTAKEIALSAFMTRAFRELGKIEDAARSREDLRSSLKRASDRCLPIPDWLREEAAREIED